MQSQSSFVTDPPRGCRPGQAAARRKDKEAEGLVGQGETLKFHQIIYLDPDRREGRFRRGSCLPSVEFTCKVEFR